jgi:uroporphyrinogen-III synthase
VTRPLSGRRILVTRRREQASGLADKLRGLGADVVEVPAIEVAPPEDTRPLDAAVRGLARYDWVVFTSANALEAVRDRAKTLGLEPAFPRVASVGAATRQAVTASFPRLAVDLEPAAGFRAEGLLAAFAEREVRGQRILLPTSDRGRAALPAGLRALGASVDVVVAYRTLTPKGLAESLAEELAAGIDAALFASPSAVQGLSEALPEGAAAPPAVVIGPTSEAAARAAGFSVLAVASPSTTDGLVAAVIRALARFS